MKPIQFRLMVFALSLIASGVAQAQATRTWVSGVGDDANPCSRTAPCKTFAGAISKTATAGEIDALDPGGFGSVTVVKSITIDGGPGNLGGILAAYTSGINVNAIPGSVVSLRNLEINGSGTGTNGITLVAGAVLHVEHCFISGFVNNGINIATSAAVQVSVVDTISRDNAQNGLFVQNTTGLAEVLVSGSHFDNNTLNGIWASDFSKVTVRNSEAAGNGNAGYLANGGGSTATMNIVNSTAAHNRVSGIQAGGGAAASSVRVAGVSIFTQAMGFSVLTNGAIISFGNNFNTGGGTPTATLGVQ
ncbi:MAG: right-handed parallel beta-helix repeat-containing protein [Candidatus Sulfotelmatobacter sp.]